MILSSLVVHAEGKAASEMAMLMREALWHREDGLWQLKLSRASRELSEAVGLADESLWATEKAIGGWWNGHAADFQSLLETQHQRFLKLAGWGWGTLELRREAVRYHPKLMPDGRGGDVLRFYDPRTGNYDSPVDRGWTLCGLPPHRKFEGK